MRDDLYIKVLDEAEQSLEAGNMHSLSATRLFDDIAASINRYVLDDFDDIERLPPVLKFAIAKGIKEWCDTL